MTTVGLAVSVVLCAAALGWGYLERGLEGATRVALAAGALWLFALWRRMPWFSGVGLLGAVIAAAAGLLLDVSAAWMLAGAVFALIAWDLTEFRGRLSDAADEDDLRGIERRHLLRLSFLALGALTLASLGMVARLRVSFEWMLLLVLVTALSLAQFLRWLRENR